MLEQPQSGLCGLETHNPPVSGRLENILGEDGLQARTMSIPKATQISKSAELRIKTSQEQSD
jgi:hypothetical protein